MASLDVTYADYSTLFPAGWPNRLSEEAFSGFLPSAEAYVKHITHNRAEGVEAAWLIERVKQAVCVAANEMAAEEAARGQGGARVRSVSNDGYTETYGALDGGDGSAIRRAVFACLSGTGLVSCL